MKRAVLVIALGLPSCAGTPPKEAADLVLRNGKIVTVDETRPEAQALAARDRLIGSRGGARLPDGDPGDRRPRRRVLFDIYEKELGRHPEKSHYRWRIEHAHVIHPHDLPRFAKLGVIPGIQGTFACSDGPWVLDRLGEERTRSRPSATEPRQT